MTKKSYNPFKMWGSWAGLVLSIIYLMFSTKYYLFDIRDILLRIGFTLSAQTGGLITATLLSALIGFLIGWGIHSLIRMLKHSLGLTIFLFSD